MTPEQIREKSNEIDNGININRRRCEEAKTAFTTALNKLTDYPTDFSEYLTASNFQEPFTDVDEELLKVKRDKQIVSFNNLSGAIQTVVTFLDSVTF